MIVARKNIELVKTYKPGKPIDEVKRELGLDEVYKLASNESPFGPSENVYKAMVDAAKSVNLYPDSNCFYLRQELAKRLQIEPEQLIFGNGSDELIALAIKAFVEDDENIVIAAETFLMYEVYANVCGVGLKKVPMQNYKYDLDAMLNAIDEKTKIVFVANPDNPNGTYCTKDEINSFVENVPSSVMIFLDEAYYEFMPSDGPEASELIKKYENVFYTRTFSKTYGLAGLRIGYGVSNKELISTMAKVRDPFNINSIAQAGALAALMDEDYLNKVINYTYAEKKYIYSELDKLGLNYIKSATNFILIDTARDANVITESLMKNGIVVRNMTGWGYDGFIRLSMGLHEQNEKFIRVLKQMV